MSRVRFARVRITPPPGAAVPRTIGAPATAGATKGGSVARPDEHWLAVHNLSDRAILGIVQDSERQGNLRDYSNHEKRWWANRSSAARAIRRERQKAGTWSIPKAPKRS